MKKILFLLLLIGGIGIGKNLDQYESKRVFDKMVDSVVNGNYEQYIADDKMTRILEELEIENWNFFKNTKILSGNKYIVTDVKETKNESVLLVSAEYKMYDVSGEDFWDMYIDSLYELYPGEDITENSTNYKPPE